MAERSQHVAAGSGSSDEWSFGPRVAENSRSHSPAAPRVAEVATIAAPAPEMPWSDGLRRLLAMPRPARRDEQYWDAVTGEASVTSRLWGQRALDAGWEALDLFGCNPDPYAGRIDRNGLVLTLANFAVGLRMIAITPEHAEMHGPRGEVLRYRREGKEGQAYLWDAYTMTSGP